MGGRGSFDKTTMSIPVENRKYKTLDVVDGIKIIEDFETGNGNNALQGACFVLEYFMLCDLCQVWEFRPMLSIRLIVTDSERTSVTGIY